MTPRKERVNPRVEPSHVRISTSSFNLPLLINFKDTKSRLERHDFPHQKAIKNTNSASFSASSANPKIGLKTAAPDGCGGTRSGRRRLFMLESLRHQ
jgi:hypothetical protein